MMARGVGEGAIIRERRLFYKVPSKGRGEAIFSREAINRGTAIIRKVTFFLSEATKFVLCSSKNIHTPPPPLPRRALFSTPPEGV